MAIINSIAFGKSRKSTGNVVFYDRLGQTIARQKNLTPTNPNTWSQVAQRVLITNPSRSYRSIVDATSPAFGNKFFDYAFGRSYLATKRRTSYNEFFLRAMKVPFPAFLSKSEVLDRIGGVCMNYELSQGSLSAPLLVPASGVDKTEMALVATGSTASPALGKALACFLASNNYELISDFKAVVIVQMFKWGLNSEVELATAAGLISMNANGEPIFTALTPGFALVPDVDKIKVNVTQTSLVDQGFETRTFCVVPFGTVNGVYASANVSLVPRFDEVEYQDVIDHSSNMAQKDIAIASYNPSTPKP